MHIEGNALILGDSSYLEHHGIKGQKWGIRRFQNEDGSLTPLGEKRIKKLKKIGDKSNKQNALMYGQSNLYSAKSIQPIFGKFKNLDSETEVLKAGAKINRIATENEPLDDKRKYVSFTPGDNAKYKFFAEVKELGLPKDAEPYAYQFRAIKDIRIANGKAIESFIVNDIKATSTSKKQKEEAKKIIEAFDKHLENEAIIQGASKVLEKAMSVKEGSDNHFYKEAGIKANDQIDLYRNTIKTYLEGDPKKVEKLADHLRSRGYDAYLDMIDARSSVRWKYGTDYPLIMMSPKDNMELVKSEKLKHASIGGSIYIQDTALIVNSSYLSHHGIRGQRWGVRRFQNRDGSLTNAGRKRLGYATKGVTQTVGKAFKAGVKAGGNAIKAVKAHHEKKEAEKLQKKKEKASKTRLGVMANKDLFTNEEIRKLNERFKLEDEMKMATLQKGVEIAKAVGTIAQNVGTVAKTYEDVTGQSLSPIKRKAAEEKARQEKEDRERRLAREDADEARKVAKEERAIELHKEILRKNIADADTQEFLAKKTKAQADSEIIDAMTKAKKFNDDNGGGDTDSTGQSWVEKAKNGGKNPFDDMIANRDPEYAQIRKEHDEKVARKERIAELERREKEREAEKAAAKKQSAPQQKQGGGDDDALFSQKGSLPIDKDRYRNNRAMEKAKQVKEDAAEERAKKQDEKAAKATIDDMMEARRQFTDSARANSNGAFDRETAANYIKGKAKELPSKLNPINAIAKKITNKALKEEEDNARKTLEDEYKKASRSQGRDEANYTMYYNRVNALQSQGYSERQAKKVADTENPFSSKRNRRFEYNEKVGEIETTHRKNAKEINKANKELTDYYYKLVNGPGYEPGSPKREALDRKYAQKRGELERLEKDNNEMLDREKKKAKKILEHSFSIQNGVLFVDKSVALSHHGVKGQRWGVRRFQNPDGSLTDKGRKHYEKKLAKAERKKTAADAARGYLERTHGFAVTASAVLSGAAYASLMVASAANPATIALGTAVVAAMYGGATHLTYSVNEAWEGRGSKKFERQANEYREKLKQSDKEEGMYHVENGTLFINAGEPYLEHHGVLGMKWGKHLRAGKGPADASASAGGGGGEDDEKLKEMAKKAGMSVAEYKQKFASKIGGAASKVGEKVYDAAGGSHKKNAEGWRKMAREESNAAMASEKSAHENSARAASQDRKYGSGGDVYRRAAESDKEDAKTHQSNAKSRSERAASEQKAYEKSLAGKYDKMKAGGAEAGKRARKAVNELSAKAVAAKKRLKDVPGELYGSKHRKDFERNARLLEGSTRSAVEIGRDTYKRHGPTSGFGDPTYKATDDAYKRANKQWNKARISGQKYDRSIAKRVDSIARKVSKARKTAEQKKLFSGTSPKAKKAVIAKKKVTPTSYEKQISNARDDVEKAARANENAYKHAKAVYRQTGSDSDAYKQAIKRSGTTLQRYIDSKKLLEKKKRAKHFDDTNAIYTEGTRLVINSKWG